MLFSSGSRPPLRSHREMHTRAFLNWKTGQASFECAFLPDSVSSCLFHLCSKPALSLQIENQAPPARIDYDGFCIDATPAQFDWRTVKSSANVDGWIATVQFLPLLSVPLPLARNKGSKHDEGNLGDPAEQDTAAEAVPKLKKPAGNL